MTLANIEDVRAILIKLLDHPDSLTEMDQASRFMVVTSASRIMAEGICAEAQYDRARAILGLETLIRDVWPHIAEICDRERARALS